MALSRTITQSLPRVHPLFPLITLRRGSTKASPQLIEVDLDSPDSTEAIAVGIRKLEDAIQNLIVQRAAPDWLPFLPGYSYWVPPLQRSQPTGAAHAEAASVVEVVRKLASASASLRGNRSLLIRDYLASDDEQRLTMSSSRGWPSSDFFTQDVEKMQHLEDSEDDSHDEENEE